MMIRNLVKYPIMHTIQKCIKYSLFSNDWSFIVEYTWQL